MSNSSTERAYDEGGARVGGMKCAIMLFLQCLRWA